MLHLIIAMIIWGSIGAVVLWSGLSAIEASFFRCVLGALVLLPYCWLKGDFSARRYSSQQIGLVALGGVLIVFNWVLLFQSFAWSSITLGNVSYYMQPVFLVLLGMLFFHERISGKRWLFILLTFIGVILTVDIGEVDLQLDRYKVLGIFCALGAGLLYAFATIVAKYIREVPPSLMTLIQLLVGCIMLFPFISYRQLEPTASLFLYVLIIGVVHTAVAYILYYKAVKVVSVTNIAIIGYIDPIVAIISDILFFQRQLDGWQVVGIVLTMVGSYFVVKLATDSRLAANDQETKGLVRKLTSGESS